MEPDDNDIQRTIDALTNTLLRKMGDEVDLIFRYGSHVRGTTHKYSDTE